MGARVGARGVARDFARHAARVGAVARAHDFDDIVIEQRGFLAMRGTHSAVLICHFHSFV